MKNEDNNRISIEFGEGKTWKAAKVIFVKKDCTLGEHYHKIKTERFMLVYGFGTIMMNGKNEIMKIGKVYNVKPDYMHTFHFRKDAVMVGLMTEKFNPKDDYED